MLRLLRALVVAALWVSVGAYAVHVGHDFFHHVDRAVWVTTDDGEASIAYALAQHGRYAFLPSPLLENMPRLHGQFNYGPWYFYLAAAAMTTQKWTARTTVRLYPNNQIAAAAR